MEKSNTKKIILGVISFTAVVLLFGSFTVIGVGKRGVIVRLGAVQDRVLEEGIHLKLPFIERVVKVDVRMQKYQVAAPSFSKDLQNVDADIALNYHIIPSEANKILQLIGSDYEQRVIAPALQEQMKATTAKFTAAEMVSKRALVKVEIQEGISKQLKGRFIQVDEFSIVNLNFSDSYEKSIEQKQVAEQNALKAENDLRRIEIEATQKVASARAEAESLRIQAEALQQNQKLIDLEAIRKWNGVLPQYNLGGATPFISLPSTGK